MYIMSAKDPREKILNYLKDSTPWNEKFDEMEFSKEIQFFYHKSITPTTHWFFIQGIKAIYLELHLPAVLSLIGGIESSLRHLLHMVNHNKTPNIEPPDNVYLKANTLNKALKHGIPIHFLAFPDENIIEILKNNKSPDILTIRNELFHGSIHRYKENIGNEQILSPSSLNSLCADLYKITYSWIGATKEYWDNHKNSQE